jgi:hypothetical protein
MAENVICPKCHKQLTYREIFGGTKYCPYCGAKLALPPPIKDGKIIVKAYLHGDKDSDYDQAEEIGLSESATDNFVGWGYEIEFDLEVEFETGNTKIIAVNGRKLG